MGWLVAKYAELTVARELWVASSRFLQLARAEASQDWNYTSYILWIGSHAEQVLLVFPYDAILARFGWNHTSGDMAAFYFDRSMLTNTSSYCFWWYECHSTNFHTASACSVTEHLLASRERLEFSIV